MGRRQRRKAAKGKKPIGLGRARRTRALSRPCIDRFSTISCHGLAVLQTRSRNGRVARPFVSASTTAKAFACVTFVGFGNPELDRVIRGRCPVLRLGHDFVGRNNAGSNAPGRCLEEPWHRESCYSLRTADMVALAEALFPLDARHADNRGLFRHDAAMELNLAGHMYRASDSSR